MMRSHGLRGASLALQHTQRGCPTPGQCCCSQATPDHPSSSQYIPIHPQYIPSHPSTPQPSPAHPSMPWLGVPGESTHLALWGSPGAAPGPVGVSPVQFSLPHSAPGPVKSPHRLQECQAQLRALAQPWPQIMTSFVKDSFQKSTAISDREIQLSFKAI